MSHGDRVSRPLYTVLSKQPEQHATIISSTFQCQINGICLDSTARSYRKRVRYLESRWNLGCFALTTKPLYDNPIILVRPVAIWNRVQDKIVHAGEARRAASVCGC